MDTVQILEGGFDQHPEMEELFRKMGMEILPQIDNLYNEPDNLDLLKERNPDFLYIRTTGMVEGGRLEARKQLKQKFQELKWVPDNVIFFNDESVFAFHEVAKKLKEHGTRFWGPPSFIGTPELTPINWI